jgi:hypothetical protein
VIEAVNAYRAWAVLRLTGNASKPAYYLRVNGLLALTFKEGGYPQRLRCRVIFVLKYPLQLRVGVD